MRHLLMMTFADSFNSFMYLLQSPALSIFSMMRWVLFTKLFVVAHIAVSEDDRLPELAVCYLLTSLSIYVTAKACQRVVAEHERLKKCGYADVYILLYLDVPF